MSSGSLLTTEGLDEGPRDSAFRFRRGSRADLPRCLELLPAGFKPPAEVQRRLIDLWDQLITTDASTFSVVEDIELTHPSSLVGFGLSVFVTEQFFSDFFNTPKPYVSTIFYQRLMTGDHVVLSPEELRRENSTTGLNVLVLHFGLCNEDVFDRRTAQVLAAGSTSFFFFHSGYRIKSFLNEVFGPRSARYMELGGFRLVNDFHRESPADFDMLPPQQHPYLFMLRKEWVEPGVIHPLSQMFYTPAARLRFSRIERLVLEGALLNESDSEVAERLGMSLDTVKKTWRNIYIRTGRGLPNLVPGSGLASNGNRGREKRRHLLEYLRMHLEELRPSGPAGRRSTTQPAPAI